MTKDKRKSDATSAIDKSSLKKKQRSSQGVDSELEKSLTIKKEKHHNQQQQHREHEENEVPNSPNLPPSSTEPVDAAEAKRLRKLARREKKQQQKEQQQQQQEEEEAETQQHIDTQEESETHSVPSSSSAPSASVDAEDEFDLSSLRTAKHSSSSSSPSASSSSAAAESSRVFVGNLSFKITDELLTETFSPFGTIAGIHWVTDKTTGQFYGTAFVDYNESDAADKAIEALNGTVVLNRPMKVNYATGANAAGQNRFNQKQKGGAHLASYPISEKPEDCTNVFLGNLSFNIDEEMVTKLFEHCGEITDIRWVEKDGKPTDKQAGLLLLAASKNKTEAHPISVFVFSFIGEFKGCGFVEFANTEATDLAIKLNGQEVMGRPMRVDYSGGSNKRQREY